MESGPLTMVEKTGGRIDAGGKTKSPVLDRFKVTITQVKMPSKQLDVSLELSSRFWPETKM